MLALPLTGSTPELYHGKYVAGMYGSGEQGVWYEPSLSNGTLFQDAAGTTPVTAVEQPVGLMKDKSGRGNHAKQTTSADRPVFSARYNLLTRTEQFNDSYWPKSNVSVTANVIPDPLGGNTADLMLCTASSWVDVQLRRYLNQQINTRYSLSVYAKKNTTNWLRLRNLAAGNNGGGDIGAEAWFNLALGQLGVVRDGGSGAQVQALIEDAENGWYKCTLLGTTLAAISVGAIDIALTTNNSSRAGAVGDSIYLWGASLVPANQAHLPYQRANTATDYDADPVKFPPYLKFNGTNSWMVTNSIDFTGTDKMTVFVEILVLGIIKQGCYSGLEVMSIQQIPGYFGLRHLMVTDRQRLLCT